MPIQSTQPNQEISQFFGNSIIRGILLNEFKSFIKNGFAKLKSFSGATSKEVLQYVHPPLEGENFNTAPLHVEVYKLLNSNNPDRIFELLHLNKKL